MGDNKLAEQMRIAKRIKTIEAIAEIVKKYSDVLELQIDTEILSSFAPRMISAYSTWHYADKE